MHPEPRLKGGVELFDLDAPTFLDGMRLPRDRAIHPERLMAAPPMVAVEVASETVL